jgi:peptidoglycan hydrolase CwlO-like protein
VQIYVLNRARETLATTSGIYDDKHTLTLDAGSSSYEFKISKNDEASRYMDSGNYIVLQNDGGKTWLFTILDYEETQYTKTVYAEDAGIELLNKACDIWKANGPHSFEYYFNLVTSGTPWKLGVNQLAGLERTLTYEGRDTGLGRLLSILKGFDNAECTFDVTVKMNAPSDFKINVYKQVGSDRSDVQMVYSHELDDIVKKESRAEFVTALCGVGGTIQTEDGQGNTQDAGNIDFADLEYNKDGLVTTKGDKFLRAVDANKRFNPGQATYIEAFYEYDTQSASELLNRTITRLKTYSEPQYTYTADVKIIDSTLKIGDTVTIIDHDYNPALYLSARVAKLEKSYTDPSKNAIEFCNYRLLSSRLADKLARLQTVVNKLPSASQVGKLESNVSDLSKKQEELASQITSANGKNTNYYGKTEPATPKNGDLWYKKLENGEIEMYQYQDGVWQLLASTADLTTVQTELDQAKADMAQAKTDAQTAYDEAVKATGTANGAKAQTDEALKQAKQANDSYTALAKEVADNKTSTDADYKQAQADIAQAQKDLASVTDTVTEVKKGQGELSTKIAGKVDNTIYQTYVTQTNKALSEKLVASDLNGYAKTVDVTKSINGVKTTVADNAGKISTMQADVNGIKTNVKNAQGDISSLQTDAKSIKATVSDHTGKITQLTTDVNGIKSSVSSKVDKTTYQSYVAQTDKALSAKLTASDLKGYAKTVDVKHTTDGLSASITKLQGNLAYQATELIGKKSFEDGNVGDWTCNDCKTKAAISGITSYSAYGYHKCIYAPNNNDLCWNVDCKVNPGDKYYVELLVPNFYSVHGGRTINVRGLFRYTKDGKTAWQPGPSGQVAGSTAGWIKGIITVPDGITSVKPCISVKDGGVTSAAYLTYASFTKLDDYTQSQLNTLSGKITATSDRLSSVYTKSETDTKLKTKVEQSALTQTSNNLSASIAKNSKILSSAGLVNENAYINANKIALNGKTLMTNATINDAFVGNLSANKITTGTLNAAKVNLINVNASNISTGTLSGVKITSTGKDPSGTSSTTNIQSGYIDTNVINCSDYILVGKADTDPRKRWQTKQTPQGMWFQTPAKITGHTGNAVSDWQTEWQGFMGGDGWNYRNTTVTGTGYSGIQLALTPQQEWGNPYGGDMMSFGTWIRTETSNKTKNILDGTLDPFLWYSYTGQSAAYKDTVVIPKPLRVFGETHFDWDIHVKGGGSHGIRTAWVSWSDWGSNQKIPCIVQDTTNWGGIAFPSNGRVVLFTHGYRINTDGLPKDKGGTYNGWGS